MTDRAVKESLSLFITVTHKAVKENLSPYSLQWHTGQLKRSSLPMHYSDTQGSERNITECHQGRWQRLCLPTHSLWEYVLFIQSVFEQDLLPSIWAHLIQFWVFTSWFAKRAALKIEYPSKEKDSSREPREILDGHSVNMIWEVFGHTLDRNPLEERESAFVKFSLQGSATFRYDS